MDSRPLYEPIDRGSNSIRLLRLLKGAKHYEDDPIRCELFEVPLPDDDCDEAYYDALSYTWGDASQIAVIIIDGRPTTVTVNLREALRYLRLTDEDRILWVDAVCINQGDQSERMHQVGMMGDIFKKAREVIIWLGTSTREIELLMKTAQELDKKMLNIPKPPVNDPNYVGAWLDTARRLLANMGLENVILHQMRIKGLQDMLSRAWWSRIWVIQEAANAPRARIQCSWHSVSTRTFALMPQIMGVTVEPRQQVLLEVFPGPLRRHSWWYKDRSLQTLLEKFQHSKSTEECDQIYALLGMSSEARIPGCPLQADYSLDMTRVVQNVVTFLAFGRVFYLKASDLPTWDLSNLRNFMPSLKPSLLAWAITKNRTPLIRELVFSKPPLVAINNRLPTDVNTSLPPQMRYIMPPPAIHLAICLKFQDSVRLVKLLLKCEDLDVNIPGFKPPSPAHGTAQVDIYISRSVDKYTPLSHAASMGRTDLVHLFSAHPDIKLNQKDPEGFTPIERALENSHFMTANALITMNNGFLKSEGWRLLHQAIKKDHIDMVKLLLSDKDVDVNELENGFNPLSLAANLGRDEIVQKLFTREDLKADALDPAGFSPLERAFRGNHETTAAVLLNKGGRSLLQNEEGHFLHLAVEKDWPGIVKILISQGVSPDTTQTTRKARIWISPLSYALGFLINRRESIVQVLLEAGANPDPSPPNPNLAFAHREKGDWHPVVSVIKSGSLDLLEMLMNTGQGAQKTTWNTPNEPPLLYAIRKRHASMVEFLLARGADIAVRTADKKMSSFWLAVEYKAPLIMRLLADAGADFSISAQVSRPVKRELGSAWRVGYVTEGNHYYIQEASATVSTGHDGCGGNAPRRRGTLGGLGKARAFET